MIKFTQRGKSRVITLAGDLSIEHASDLHTAFLKCSKADSVRVDLKKLASLDLSIVQLLYSAQKGYQTMKKNLEIDFSVKSIQAILDKSGIQNKK